VELTGGNEDNPIPVTGPNQSEVESLRLEVANLRAERAALQAQLSAPRVTGSNQRLRRSLVALLAGVSCVLIFLSLMTVWVHQTVLDTDGFVAAVGPVVDRPNVTQAMSVELTTQIFEAIDVERQIKQVLPSQGQFLAAPLTSAAENFVQGQVRNVLRSPQFRAVWFTVLRAAHKEVLAALRGQSSVLSVTNGAVVLNTLPLVNAALQQVQSLASGLLGRHVTIPPLTKGELPAQIRATLSEALGVNLPADFGQIELARSGSLDLATNAVQVLDVLYWLLPLLTLLAISAALWWSPNRRRTALQILIGTAVALVVERRAESWIQDRVIASLSSANRAAGTDVVHQVLHGLASVTSWVLIVALVTVALLLLTGPYHWARALRARTAHVFDAFTGTVSRRPGGEATVAWVVHHRRALQAAGALVGGVLLLVVPGWWFLVVLLLLAGYEVVIWRAGVGHADHPAVPETVPPHAGPPLSTPPGEEGAAASAERGAVL
jgi:hypothetical protein